MVFLNSGFFIASAVGKDRYHESAEEAMRKFIDDETHLFTSNYVIQETITWIVYSVGSHKVRQFAQKLTELEREGILDVIWIDRILHKRSLETLIKYKDHPFSFVDASIITIAKHLKLKTIYTTDKTLKESGLNVVLL